MSEKSKKILQLQGQISPGWEVPALPEGMKLVEVGLACVLARRLSAAQVEKTLKALGAAYPDWNELRISQVQEFVGLLATKSDDLSLAVARDVKAYLQEVFQKNHGFDLEFLREDPAEAGKFVSQLEFLGGSAGHFLIWYATGGSVPATGGIVRVLDRLGVMKRTSSMRKAQEALDKLVPEGDRRDFALRFGLVVERWCDAKKPLCWECVLVESCPWGKKVRKDWSVQQKRLEEQRKREEERRLKEEERARKKALTEAKRRAAEDARRRVKEEKERKRLEEKRAKEEARRKALEAKQVERAAREVARKKAQAEKAKAAVKKAAAAKKAAAKKKPSRKGTSSKAKKTPSKKKPPARKPTTKKKVSTKKKTTKKPASTKRSVTRKPTSSRSKKAGGSKSSKKRTSRRR